MITRKKCFSSIPTIEWQRLLREAEFPYNHQLPPEVKPSESDKRIYIETNAVVQLMLFGLKVCLSCKGHGQHEENDCLECHGAGTIRNTINPELMAALSQHKRSRAEA